VRRRKGKERNEKREVHVNRKEENKINSVA
jgi:hypothetical protein